MSVIVEKPYRFVPPHRGNGWPTVIQTFRLVDRYLRRKEGIVEYECRNIDRLRESIDQQHGILLAPNHCRYADPLVMGWPARELGKHVYAIASWHLFNKNRFEAFAIRKMGGFSLFREGQDRQSLETAINILVGADRPLILFPEGTTNRTNDSLQPLLEGITFIARTAARRRKKLNQGNVVIHPVGIKYVFLGDIQQWADQGLRKIEQRLGWLDRQHFPLLQRIGHAAEGLLSLGEIEHLGGAQQGALHARRIRLIEGLLQPIEETHRVSRDGIPVLHRVRALRTKLLPMLLAAETQTEKNALRRTLGKIELAQKLESYVEGYLTDAPITDTRAMETIQRMQEDFLGKADSSLPLKVVIDFDPVIAVPPEKAPKGAADPLLTQIEVQLGGLLNRLQYEANVLNQGTGPRPV